MLLERHHCSKSSSGRWNCYAKLAPRRINFNPRLFSASILPRLVFFSFSSLFLSFEEPSVNRCDCTPHEEARPFVPARRSPVPCCRELILERVRRERQKTKNPRGRAGHSGSTTRKFLTNSIFHLPHFNLPFYGLLCKAEIGTSRPMYFAIGDEP